MNLKSKMKIFILASVFLSLPIYIILHEGGHSLVAMLCGARITQFSITKAYMSYDGGSFNSFTLSLFYVAGMALPVFVSNIYMLLYKKQSNKIFYKIFSFFVVVIPIGSIIAWVIVPILYLFGAAPANDDVTKFMNTSSVNPLIVTLVASILLFLNITVCWHKRIIQNYWLTVSCIK